MATCMHMSILSPFCSLQTPFLPYNGFERRFCSVQYCVRPKESTSSLHHERRHRSAVPAPGTRWRLGSKVKAAQSEPVTESTASPSWSTVTVGEVMNASPVVVGPDTTIWEVMKMLVEKRISGVAVVDEQRQVLGFVSGYDLLALDASPGRVQNTGLFPTLDMPWSTFKDLQKKLQTASGRTAREIMSPVKDKASPSDRVEDAANIMIKERRHRVIVVNEDGSLAGIVSRTDVLRATVQAMGYVLEEESRESGRESGSDESNPFVSRRDVLASWMVFFGALQIAAPKEAGAYGDPTVTIEEVTREVTPPGKLSSAEEATVELFERTTYSVVNVFDVALRPAASFGGAMEVPEGNGSGIVWDNEGHIVTNFHVIGSSLKRGGAPGTVVARVALLGADGLQKNYNARLVGADKTKDLAVLKIDAPPEVLRPVPIGESDGLKVGQRCLAIGNPFGFDHTLTTGVVSGLNRDIQSQVGTVIAGGIQTDAAINPGNSGGPLLDGRGNLIGINTAIFTASGTSAGVGFAIPSDLVARIVPQLISYGKVMRPSLNVQLAAPGVAKKLNINSGALILSVPDKSAAAKAGLLATRRGLAGNIIIGDVIVALDDIKIKSPVDVDKVLDRRQVGDQVVVKVLREDKTIDLPLSLEETSR